MYQTKNRKSGKVIEFSFRPGGQGRQGAVAGDFSQWKQVKMERQSDGSFVAAVAVGPGVYQYKFVVDGSWQTDPDNSSFAISAMGTVNSVAHLL
jgi:1,4-alpha-glucan branching enzyme